MIASQRNLPGNMHQMKQGVNKFHEDTKQVLTKLVRSTERDYGRNNDDPRYEASCSSATGTERLQCNLAQISMMTCSTCS